MEKANAQKYYIGIAAGFHDGAIALVNENGEIVFAEATERFIQNKRAFTSAADNYFFSDKIINHYNFSDYEIAINWQAYNNVWKHTFKSFINYCFRNYTEVTKYFAKKFRSQNPDEYAASLDLNFTAQMASLFQAGTSLRNLLIQNYKLDFKKIHSFDHHLTHAYYAYYTSNFTNATILIIDGNGDKGSSISIYNSSDHIINLLFRNKNTCSLGDYYGRITELCGFDHNKGEQWKMMGLAPYGKINAELLNLFNNWIEVVNTGICYKDEHLFFEIRKLLNTKLNVVKADIAFTGQYFYETIIITLINNIYLKYPNNNLIISGGCALNSAANGKVHTNTPFKNVFISSAPADDGCAIGAALLNFKKHNPNKNIPLHQLNPYLGFDIEESEIENFKNYSGYRNEKLSYQILYKFVAEQLQNGKIIGWVQGRAEFGPRALGNRSILANPCISEMKDKINSHVKFREEFRPFAPSILEEFAKDYFEDYYPTPYMERVLLIKEDKRSVLKAVNHIDNTGRLQSVNEKLNPHFYNLIKEFYNLTDVPVILNTSFNVMGKPIVDSVTDMAAVFATSGIDLLVINDTVFFKD